VKKYLAFCFLNCLKKYLSILNSKIGMGSQSKGLNGSLKKSLSF
jgi:hypothetical protein